MSNTLQRDLFQPLHSPAAGNKTSSESAPVAFLERYRIPLRLDHVLFGVIGFVVLYAMVFSWGVEKGRQIVRSEWRAAEAAETAAAVAASLEIVTPLVAETGPSSGSEGESLLLNTKVEPVSGATAAVSESVAEKTTAKPVGKYTIQVITYKWQPAAERRAKELAQKGLTTYVIPSGQYFLVCVDSFDSKEKARLTLSQLKTQKFIPADAYIRPVGIA